MTTRSGPDSLTLSQKLKLVGITFLAIAVALSWLGMTFVVGPGVGGFAVQKSGSSDGAGSPNTTRKNLSADAVREALKRTNRGGKSSISMTAIWATPTYFEVSEITPEGFNVNPSRRLVFIVFLNTHTGALPQMYWKQNATLIVDGKTYEPVAGRTRAGGYHHSVAVVEFPRTVNGDRILTEQTRRVTLKVVGIERTEQGIPDDRPRNVSWPFPPAYWNQTSG